MIGSVAVEEALLVLKLAFLVLLYLFIWRIVRSAARDVRMPQESFVLAPGSVPGLGEQPQIQSGRLVVVKSPALDEDDELLLDSAALLVGRGSGNDVNLARRVRLVEPRARGTAARRRLGRGRRLHQRHLPERHPPDAREAPGAG